MNVALFTNSAVYNRQANNNQKPETAGSIAFISKPATSLFTRNDQVAFSSAPSVETAGSIASSSGSGLNGQASTGSAGGSLSVAA